METKKEKKTFFCGKCHKEYTSKQNLLKHYSLEKIKTKCDDSKAFLIKDNLCFNDPGPRVWDTNLEKAIKRHDEQVKLSLSATSFFKVQQPSTSSTSSILSCSDDLCTTYTNTYEEDQTPCKKRKVAEEENKDCKITSNSDSDIKAALDILLKYQKETLEKVNENNQH